MKNEFRNTAKNKSIETTMDAAIHFHTLNDAAKKKVIQNIITRMRLNENNLQLQQLYRWANKNLENPKQHPPENLLSY